MRLLADRTRHEQAQQSLARVTLLYNGGFAVILAGGLSFLLAGNTRKMELLNTRLNEQIDRRKKAEKEAAVLNKHNQMLLEATHEGIAGVNQSGRITFFNPSAEQITGYSAAEAIGKSLHELVHSKRPDGTRYPVEECPIMLALRDGKAHSGDDEVFIRKDGKQVPVDFTTAPLIEDAYAEETKRHGAVVVFRDITRRKREEATRDEIAAIITHANDAIISFSLEGVVTSWNRAATRIYGFAEHEMVGQYMDKLLPPNQTDELPALVEKIKNNEAVPGYVTTRIRKDGERIRVLFLLSPIKDRSGRVTGVSSISYEAKRTEIGNSGPVASVIESVVKSSGAKSVVGPN
jgi:PAS domain S-box-containing protein